MRHGPDQPPVDYLTVISIAAGMVATIYGMWRQEAVVTGVIAFTTGLNTATSISRYFTWKRRQQRGYR